MTFKTTCPHCSAELEMDEQWSGEEGTCPQCRKSFVIPSRPEPPKPIPMTAPVSAANATSAAADAPSPSVPPLRKVSFRPAAESGERSARRTPATEKTIICPKCRKRYTVNRNGVYPCRCGTTLELLENGAVNVHMKLPKHGIGFYIMLVILLLLLAGTLTAAALAVFAAQGE